MKFKFGKNDTDAVKGVDAGSIPSPVGHEATAQTPAPPERRANGGTSALLRQAAKVRTSQRHMRRRGGTVSIAAVADHTWLAPRQVVHAATGNNFILGQLNDANTATQLQPTSNTFPDPLFHLNGSVLAGGTTIVVDGPQSTTKSVGTGVVINGGPGGTGLTVSGNSVTGGTVGLAISANGVNDSGGIVASSGSGTAVSGSSNTGTAVAGNISNASSSADAVSGNTTGTGAGVAGTGARGGDFTGSAATIRLRPASGEHPASGEIGDLFVDSAGRLFYCRTGGTNATWVKLA